MRTTSVFMSGNSQAVRLPKDFQFDAKEVEIFKRGDEVVLRKKHKNMSILFDVLISMPEDTMAGGRYNPPSQERLDIK
jgi:antitoxin VapB